MKGQRKCGVFASEIKTCQTMTADEVALWKKTTLERPEYHSAFYTYSFFTAVSAVYQHVYVSVIRKNGQIVCLFPFQLMKGVARLCLAGERIGEEMSDYFAPIYTADVLISSEQLMKLSGLHYFHFIDLDEYFVSQQNLETCGEEIAFRIHLDEEVKDYMELLKAGDKKLYDNTRKKENKAIRDYGSINFVFQNKSQEVIHFLIKTKQDQYRRKDQEGYLSEDRLRFLKYILEHENDEFALNLSSLSFGNTIAAAYLGLLYNGKFNGWFPCYDIQFKAYAPGRLLFFRFIQSAYKQGVRIIDRSSGDVPHKKYFANEVSYHYKGVWVQRTIRGFIYSLKKSIEWRLQANG